MLEIGELPLLRDGTIPIAGTSNIIRHLKRKGFDLDANLTSLQLAQSSSFINLIETKLYEARLHTLFMDAKNYNEDTLRVYSKQLDFMRRFYVPEILKKRVVGRLHGYRFCVLVFLFIRCLIENNDLTKRRMMLDDKQELVNEVYLNAKDVFQALSDKLSDQLFFFGDKPTTLDAVAYAHLSLHALPLLTNPKLNAILTFNFPNLTSYITRMQAAMSLYPPPVPSPSPPPLHIVSFLTNPTASFAALYAATKQSIVSLTSEAPVVDPDSDAEADIREKRKREARVDAFYKWMSVFGAVGFFVGYVLVNGIVQIGGAAEEEEEEDEFEVVNGGSGEEEGDGYDGSASVYVDEEGNIYSDDDGEGDD
ncbi:UNVERIFIED_CONTAM: metaxin 1 [Siphonaria sp. JEL0065]|nr:metaxin 1 [Siphonaria sp. JEL0065]